MGKIMVALRCPACGEQKVPQLLQRVLASDPSRATFRCRGCGALLTMTLEVRHEVLVTR